MKGIPRPVLRALEALAQSPINTSALAMAEGQDFAHDTLYRALGQPLAFFFELSLKLCRDLGGLERGYLILDDVPIQRYRSGRLGLRKMRDTATGGWAYGLSLVVLAWTDGKRRIPPLPTPRGRRKPGPHPRGPFSCPGRRKAPGSRSSPRRSRVSRPRRSPFRVE
ncbi:hypothetical protein TthHB5018_b21260 (plasmid) [Thermus thermophilus]|uniref:Transposase IS701-like DDE domain-containing protein n=1 Tax=Thermus thermophilus TaxID=274 RepID=A0A7R7YJ85_THETH|nr:hypothetical protein TthHB5018_b21260 [Thermus thermophilus]